jgi:ATP citrate (pro-S)-lyase
MCTRSFFLFLLTYSSCSLSLSLSLFLSPALPLLYAPGKYGLVKLNATVDECAEWIAERMNKEFVIEGVASPLTHFILEPFVPHKHEFYVSILANRLHTQISFSPCGGVEIEENWETVQQVNIPVGGELTAADLDLFRQAVVKQANGDASLNVDLVIEFVHTLYRFFSGMDITSIEINPFALDGEGRIAPLDLVAEVDDTAMFKNRHKWANLEFPGRLVGVG